MKVKTLALVATAALGLAGANASFACSTAAWTATPGGGETGNPVEGRPTDTNPVARYSGQCGLKATAENNFVTDGTPTTETSFRARFYVFTGLATGNVVVYRARNGSNVDQITVNYNRDTGNFSFAIPGAAAQTVAAVPSAWYSVELNWASAGTLAATVRGAGATTDSTVNITGGTSGGVIDTAQLGWITGTGTTANAGTAREGVITDAYESRRSTAIGRLCRGDANSDGTRNADDIGPIRDEVFRIALAPGQPDANEDGRVNADEVGVIRDIFFAGAAQRSCATTTL